MLFITSCCRILKYERVRSTYLILNLRKSNTFSLNGYLQTRSREFSTESKKLSDNQELQYTLHQMEALHSSRFLRNLLYPETDDEIINRLKSCYHLEDVMQIIDTNKSLNHRQVNQIVLVLRDIQKLEYLQLLLLNREHSFSRFYESQSFQKLLNLIQLNIDKMNADEISCCLLYLDKLLVNANEPVMAKLIDACEYHVSKIDDRKTVLQVLARYFLTMKDCGNIWSLYSMNQYMPYLIESLDMCQDHDYFRHITVCFQKSVPLLSSDVVEKYISKLDLIIEKRDENDEVSRIRTIIKAIIFLNFKLWSGMYINEVKRLIAAVSGHLHYLCLTEISLLYKTISVLQEPYEVFMEIESIAKNWMKQYQNPKPFVPVFNLEILFPGMKLISEDDIKCHVISLLKKINHEATCFSLSNVFNDFHQLVFNTDLKYDKTVTNLFWSGLFEFLKSSSADDKYKHVEQLMWCIHKYIHLIGSQNAQRNEPFERSIVPCILNVLGTDHPYTYNPSIHSKLVLSIFALSKNPFNVITENVLQKLLELTPRLNIYDNWFISLILHVAADRFKDRKNNLPQFLHYYVHLNTAVNANTLDYLRENPDLSMERLNTALFTHILTKGIKTSELFKKICERFQRVNIEKLYSRSIRDSVFNFTLCEHLIPEFTDKMVEYCIREKNVITGIVISNVLNHCFLFGYTPNRVDEFLNIAIYLISRERESLLKAMYLRSALALCYFRELPTSWSDHICSVQFLEQFDEHFHKLSFNKINFLRKDLMELNRVLCIDYSEREIPWFHAKYCQELNAFERKLPNEFFTSVLNVLKSLIKTDKAINTKFMTPYGHKIDIMLHLNEDGEPVGINDCDPAKIRRIALILRSFTPFTFHKGKGKLELFVHQLEMLNYKVIVLNKQEWNSMYLSNVQEKINYLSGLIWSS